MPDGVEIHHLPGNSKSDYAYEKWLDENEDELLDQFLDANPETPPVKYWDPGDQAKWDRYVENRWMNR